VKNIIIKAQFATLSLSSEKHIRKHHKEFGFEERESFSKEHILKIVRRVCKQAERIFLHNSKLGNVIIFYSKQVLLIIDTEKNAIKTMFVLNDNEYIKRKLERKFWIEIDAEGNQI